MQKWVTPGEPTGVDVGQKYEKPELELVTVTGEDGKPMQKWVKKGETDGVNVGRQYEKPAEQWSPPYEMNGAMVQRNLSTNQIRTAVSRPPSDRPLVDLTIGPTAPGGPAAIPVDVKGPSATGGSGFFGGISNTVSDMLALPMPYPDVERATQALKNLRVQTITLMQDAVPGRPSNYLMQQIEQLAVKPGNLLQGDQRSQERLQRTRDMIATEVARMEREVLAQPKAFTTAQLNKTRLSHGSLRQLMAEYDRVLSSFSQQETPAPPPGFNLDSP